MLTHCEGTVSLLQQQQKEQREDYFKRNAHTLMFSQFGASLSVLHQLRFHYSEENQQQQQQEGEEDSAPSTISSPFESQLLAPELKSRLNALLPNENSFAEMLMSIYSPPSSPPHSSLPSNNNNNSSEALCFANSSDECEPLYGGTGLVPLVLFSINNHNNNVNRKVVENFCSPYIRWILQSGLNQSQNYRASIINKLNFILPNNPSVSSSSSFLETFFQQNPIPQLLFFWSGQAYLGGAHGTAGILYYCVQTLIRMMKMDKSNNHNHQQLQDFILSSFDDTLKICKCANSNNMPPSFSVSTSSSSSNTKKLLSFNQDDRLVQFCHGAVGFVFTCASICKLLLLTPEKNNNNNFDYWFRKLLEFGEVVWTRGNLKDSVGLCHSVSGNYFSLLAIYKVICLLDRKNKNNDNNNKMLRKVWLERVLHFAKESVTIAPTIYLEGDHIFSLYEGLGGTLACVGSALVLLANENDIEDCETFLRMPGFEV